MKHDRTKNNSSYRSLLKFDDGYFKKYFPGLSWKLQAVPAKQILLEKSQRTRGER